RSFLTWACHAGIAIRRHSPRPQADNLPVVELCRLQSVLREEPLDPLRERHATRRDRRRGSPRTHRLDPPRTRSRNGLPAWRRSFSSVREYRETLTSRSSSVETSIVRAARELVSGSAPTTKRSTSLSGRTSPRAVEL